MKPLYTKKEFNAAHSEDCLWLECYGCHKPFRQTKKRIVQAQNHTGMVCKFCSMRCKGNSQFSKQSVHCLHCGTTFLTLPCEIKKSPNHFCSKSCAAIYRNTHKSYGTRRSKLEIWLERELTALYPQLNIQFNNKEIINSELDIYFPSLLLAFELNGIFHYEPIYGETKLSQIKNNDNRKFQACLEQNIELCIIDVSKLTYCKPQKAKQFLDIITNIVSTKLRNGWI